MELDFTRFLNLTLLMFILSSIFYFIYIISSKKASKHVGNIAFLAAVGASIVSYILRWKAAGHVPLSNTYETLVAFVAFLGIAYLSLWKKDSRKIIALAVSVLGLIIVAAASLVDDTPRPLMPALQSNWLTIHVVFCFISYAAFAIAFLSSLIFLIAGDKAKMDLDKITYSNILFGFPFLTLGIITGSVWANSAWGTYWSWDPKETWSLITWLVYAIFFHTRFIQGWKGRKSAIMSVIGFAFVLFTYFGVNYLLSGLHAYK